MQQEAGEVFRGSLHQEADMLKHSRRSASYWPTSPRRPSLTQLRRSMMTLSFSIGRMSTIGPFRLILTEWSRPMTQFCGIPVPLDSLFSPKSASCTCQLQPGCRANNGLKACAAQPRSCLSTTTALSSWGQRSRTNTRRQPRRHRQPHKQRKKATESTEIGDTTS